MSILGNFSLLHKKETKALTSAISEILWRAGDSRCAVVAVVDKAPN